MSLAISIFTLSKILNCQLYTTESQWLNLTRALNQQLRPCTEIVIYNAILNSIILQPLLLSKIQQGAKMMKITLKIQAARVRSNPKGLLCMSKIYQKENQNWKLLGNSGKLREEEVVSS